MNKMYVPIPPFSQMGDAFTLHVQSIGIRGQIVVYGRVTIPVIFDRELRGRIFSTPPSSRGFTLSRMCERCHGSFLRRDIDLSREAVITDAAAVDGQDSRQVNCCTIPKMSSE
jgi:hypothetical protein